MCPPIKHPALRPLTTLCFEWEYFETCQGNHPRREALAVLKVMIVPRTLWALHESSLLSK